jgi:protease-4
MSQPSLISRLFGALWRGLTRLRLALSNLLFLAALALMYFVYIGAGPQALPDKAALLVNPVGVVVDEKSYVEPLQAFLGEPSPADNEVLLRDLIDAIEYAADDPGITALVFELDNLVYVGQSKTYEITRALENFKTSGKPVIAVGDYYSQDQYLLASHADTVIAHPMGGVMLEGYSSYRNYFRDALAKFKVNIHVFKAGELKSIAEPFERNNMSDGERAIQARSAGQGGRTHPIGMHAGPVEHLFHGRHGGKYAYATGDGTWRSPYLIRLGRNIVATRGRHRPH